MDGGKVKKPPCGGYSPPISKNKFLFFYQISKWNFFIFDFYFCRLLPWRVPFRSWFRSRFFGRCLPQLPRSSLSSAAASLSLILPGFFYCVLVRCCRFYALMLAIICLLLPGLPLGLLVPSWGCLLLGCICCLGAFPSAPGSALASLAAAFRSFLDLLCHLLPLRSL